MAIQTVQAQVNGTWHTLTYNSSKGAWETTVTAPGATSFNLSPQYYPINIKVRNTAGTEVTAGPSDMDSLKLVVKEKVAPVITITSPSSGAYITNNLQPIVFNVTDESGGSGVKLSTLVVKLDNVVMTDVTHTTITNGYKVTATPSSAMSDGSHTVTINASDNDGNAATAKSVTFKVDTVPPILNISSPATGLITNNPTCVVSGTTNDATSSPVTVTITLNGTSQGVVTIQSNGTFTKNVTLAEGSNTIVIKSTDVAGKFSTVTRNVTLDTSVPVISSAIVTPNPVDAGATMIVSVIVS